MTDNVSPLVQAIISKYIAERDSAIAKLDMYLNKVPLNETPEKILEKVSSLFKSLSDANNTLNTIEQTIVVKQKETLNKNKKK